ADGNAMERRSGVGHELQFLVRRSTFLVGEEKILAARQTASGFNPYAATLTLWTIATSNDSSGARLIIQLGISEVAWYTRSIPNSELETVSIGTRQCVAGIESDHSADNFSQPS